MTISRRSTSPTADGDKHHFDDYSGSSTKPIVRPHPSTSVLRLPTTSYVGTVNQEQETINLGTSEVPVQYPEPISRTPSDDDVLMNERDLETYMKGITKKDNGKRRAAGKATWNDQSENDDERQKYELDSPSALRKIPRRRESHKASRTPSGVSKSSGPMSGRNDQKGMTLRNEWGRKTRAATRSQTLRGQEDETSALAEKTAGGLEGGVEHMSIDDQGK
jgi:hypothetical protein